MKKMNFKKIALIVLLLNCFAIAGYSQIQAGNYYIVNADNNLAWDIDAKCTRETRECPVVLSPKSGKASQEWKIAPHDGYISIINISLDRIVSASVDFVQMNSYFPTNTNNFMAYPNSNGSFYLYQGVFDADEILHPGTKTLQPNGNLLHLAESADSTTKKQSWIFVPFSSQTKLDSLSLNNQKNSANENSAKVKDLIQQGNALKAKNDFDGAINLFQQAVQIDPNNDTAYVEMAGSYWSKKDYQNATTFAEKTKTLNTKNELAWNLLGLIAKEQKDWTKAVENFQKVIELDSQAEYTLGNLGICYGNLNRDAEAINAYTKSIHITLKKNNIPELYLYNNRGVSFVKLNRFDDAIADYNRVLEIDPNYTLAKGNLDWAWKNRPAYQYSLENSPEAAKPLIKNFIDAYGKSDFQGALNFSNQIIALDANNPIHYYNRAQIENNLKDFAAAHSDVEKSLKMNPNDAAAWVVQGNIFADENKTNELIAAYTRAIELGTNNYLPYRNRGLTNYFAKKFDAALPDLKRAAELNPLAADSHVNLGSIYSMLKRFPIALREYRKALRIEPNNALALQNMKAFFPNAKTDYSDYASNDLWGGIKTNDNNEVNKVLMNENPRLNDTAEMDYGVHLTFLQVAIKNNNPTMVESLLSFGADPDQKNSLGQTALMYAFSDEYKVSAETVKIVKLLLDADANPNIKDNRGETAMNYAAKSLKSHEAMLWLSAAGANVNNPDQNGETPLMSCQYRAHPFYVKKLIDAGANLNLKNKEGKTALDFAVNTASFGNVYYLIKSGASTAQVKDSSLSDFIKLIQNFPANSSEAKLYQAVAESDLSNVNNALSAKNDWTEAVLTYALVMAIDDDMPPILEALVKKGAAPYSLIFNKSLDKIASERRADNSAAYLKSIAGMGNNGTQPAPHQPTPKEKFIKAYDSVYKTIFQVDGMADGTACSILSENKQRVLDVRNMPNEFLDKDQIESVNSMVTFFNLQISTHKCQNVTRIN